MERTVPMSTAMPLARALETERRPRDERDMSALPFDHEPFARLLGQQRPSGGDRKGSKNLATSLPAQGRVLQSRRSPAAARAAAGESASTISPGSAAGSPVATAP